MLPGGKRAVILDRDRVDLTSAAQAVDQLVQVAGQVADPIGHPMKDQWRPGLIAGASELLAGPVDELFNLCVVDQQAEVLTEVRGVGNC